MNKRMVHNLKLARLIVAILIVVTVFTYWLYENLEGDLNLPNPNLIMTIWVSLFVFFIGLQYKIEKKQDMLANFLLLFSLLMLIATMLGFIT